MQIRFLAAVEAQESWGNRALKFFLVHIQHNHLCLTIIASHVLTIFSCINHLMVFEIIVKTYVKDGYSGNGSFGNGKLEFIFLFIFHLIVLHMIHCNLRWFTVLLRPYTLLILWSLVICELGMQVINHSSCGRSFDVIVVSGVITLSST